MEQDMTQAQFKALIGQTLFRPREAARVLISMRLPGHWLWTALALMAVLNAIVYSVSLTVAGPGDPNAPMMMPAAFHAPVLFALLLFLALVLTVLSLFWVGRKFGGRAAIEDILVLITWLQVLRLMLQVGVTILVLAMPALAMIVIMVASIWGIYILVGFVAEAHGFVSSLGALGVICLALLVMAIGLTIVFSILGVAVMEGA